MTEHLAHRQMPAKDSVQRLHMEQALAGKTALCKQVLVHLGAGSTVGVHATLAGKQPVKACHLLARRQGCGHTGLQNAVARHHTLPAGVELRLIVRMCRHTHQFTQATRRQFGVGVQREQVSHVRGAARGFAKIKERRARAVGQLSHQLLQLAAFALPAHPALFRAAVAARAMQHNKTGCAQSRGTVRVALVELMDTGHGVRQQTGIRRIMFFSGIYPVGQQGKLGLGFRIGQIVQVQAVDQFIDRVQTTEHARNHHHHTMGWRYALG